MSAGLCSDIPETVDVKPPDLDPPAAAGLLFEGIEAVATGFRAGGAEKLYVTHVGKGFHPRDAVAAVNPVVIALHCDAGDAGVLQGLESFYGFGEGAGEDLAGVEEVACDEEEIDLV